MNTINYNHLKSIIEEAVKNAIIDTLSKHFPSLQINKDYPLKRNLDTTYKKEFKIYFNELNSLLREKILQLESKIISLKEGNNNLKKYFEIELQNIKDELENEIEYKLDNIKDELKEELKRELDYKIEAINTSFKLYTFMSKLKKRR